MEAAPILYGYNTISVPDTWSAGPKIRLQDSLEDLRPETGHLVRQVTMVSLGDASVVSDVDWRIERGRGQVEACKEALEDQGLASARLVFTVTVAGKEFCLG